MYLQSYLQDVYKSFQIIQNNNREKERERKEREREKTAYAIRV